MSSTATNSAATEHIRVLLVDDQELLRRSLRIAIDREPDLIVAGEAATGNDAVEAAQKLRPDVVLMDIRMPGGDGIDATARISTAAELADTRVLILTMHELDEYVYGALRAGASGFLLKNASPSQLIDAIRRIRHGEELFAPTILTRLIEHYVDRPRTNPPPPLDGLTTREIEILTLVGQGLSNDEIASYLTVSINTVKTHISRLHAKLHARDRAQLVIAAYERHLVTVNANSGR